MKKIITSLFFLFSAIGLMSQTDVYTPTLRSPDDNATDIVPNVTLSWYAITGSTGLQYQIQLDTTPNFNSNQKVDTTLLLLTGYTTHELLFGQQYYWRVRAIDQGEVSYWSPTRTFVVFNQVKLSRPTNNSTNQVPDVDLKWKEKMGSSSLTGVKYFDYQYDSVNTFDSPALVQGTTLGDVFTAPTSELQFGKMYYYRVLARHNLSTSLWCEPWGFTVVDKMTLLLPANKTSDQMLNVQLKWTKIASGTTGYEYQLARDKDFTNLIFQQSVGDTCCYDASMLQFGETVYWRVRTRHLKDTSSWSDPWNFTTINTVILKSPKNLSVDVTLKPTLSWTTQQGIAGYELQLDDVNTFDNPIISIIQSATKTTYTLTQNLSPLKTYYWRMRAFSDGLMADTSDWSAPWSFVTVNTQGLEEPGSTSFSIYPNPANEKITIKAIVLEAKTIQVSLVDIVGKTLLTSEEKLSSGTNIKEIPLNNINKGVYILRIFSDGQTINRKVVVDR
jgi:hypothetical protein